MGIGMENFVQVIIGATFALTLFPFLGANIEKNGERYKPYPEAIVLAVLAVCLTAIILWR